MSKYAIDIYCVAVTTDISNGKIMVLSTKPEQVCFPTLSINEENVTSVTESIITLMQKYLMTNQVELSPQIISLNSSYIENKKKNTINIVAGFLIKENIKHFDSFWLEFNYDTHYEHSGLILDVIQKLR